MNHKLAPEDWEKINAALPSLYRELDVNRQQEAMFRVLGQLVAGDCIAFDRFDIRSNTIYTVTSPVDFGTPEARAAIDRHVHQSPYTSYFTVVPDPEWKSITDFMPLEDFRQTALYREGFSRIGVQHQILGTIGRNAQALFCLSVNRTTDTPFTPRDRAILAMLHPHICASLLNAQTFSTIQGTAKTLSLALDQVSGAYAYFGTDRRLVWQQPRASQWLQEFLTNEARDAAGLPQTVTRLVEAATDRVSHFQTENNSHRLSACLLPANIGGWILRFERQPLIATSHFRALPQLTPRENEVLRWMVEGKRNAEIATILDTSPRTVEKQVQSILEKLAVENRASAIVRAMELAAAETMQQGAGI